MKLKKLKIKDSFLIKNIAFSDKRGKFINIFENEKIKKKINFKNIKKQYLSINSKCFTLRGFHYQTGKYAEGKIITCLNGEIFNVFIDLRKKSKTFLNKQYLKLNDKDFNSIFVPKGCANAFLTMKKNTIVHYSVDQDYYPKYSNGFRYDDPHLNIEWPSKPKIISKKDLGWKNLETNKF